MYSSDVLLLSVINFLNLIDDCLLATIEDLSFFSLISLTRMHLFIDCKDERDEMNDHKCV